MSEERKQLCSIRIMFPVTSDKDAIAVKKVITDAVTGLENCNIMFSLNTVPNMPQPSENES